MYQRVFPGRAWWGLLWPSLGFALWHFAPQSVRANTVLFGLGWSWLAQQSGSIRWTTSAHILFDFAGLGALIYMGSEALAVP